MPSSLPLRRFALSRLPRVAALLAWLLMVISLPLASFNVMAGENHLAAGMAAMTTDHAMHAGATTMSGQHVDHCCGDATHPTCQCAAMCAAALLPSVPALHGPMQLAAIYFSVRGAAAPTPHLIPPLRPPAA